VILLRLALSAGVCGGLGLAVNLIVNKFLPELSTNPPVPQAESGEEVDIVIDEDIPLTEEANEQQSAESTASAESIEAAEAFEPEDVAEPAELTESGDEEPAEIDIVEEAEQAEDEPEEDVLSIGEGDEQQQPAPAEFVPGIAANQVENFEELDTLPEMDQFSPTKEESATPSKPSRTNSQVEEVVRNQDPEHLARAVRTFMKKDQ
jgi:hypothetical protein